MKKRISEADIKAMRKELQLEQRDMRRDFDYLKKHLDKIWEHVSVTNERLQNLEVQVNLLSRLVATLAVEKLGMKTFHLIRLIRRIEKEAITADQIQHLEDLYKLEHPSGKRKSKGDKDKNL